MSARQVGGVRKGVTSKIRRVLPDGGRLQIWPPLNDSAGEFVRALGHPYWTTPLAVDTPLAATSADLSARLQAQGQAGEYAKDSAMNYTGPKPGNSQINAIYSDGFYHYTSYDGESMPIWTLPEGTPSNRSVYSRKHKYLSSIGFELQDVLDNVPLPDEALIPGGRIAADGSDASCIVQRRYTRADGVQTAEQWDYIGLLPATAGTDPDGYEYRCTQAGYIADITEHPAWWASPPDLGVSAAGPSYMGMALTHEDWNRNAILHPMGLAIPITLVPPGEPRKLWPATRSDYFNYSRMPDAEARLFGIPEGARFRLRRDKFPDDASIDAYAAAKGRATGDRRAGATARVIGMVLRAHRDYGFIVNDTTGGIMGWSAEAYKTFGTPYSDQPEGKLEWGNFGLQLPWDSYEQVQPLPGDISAYAGQAGQPVRTAYPWQYHGPAPASPSTGGGGTGDGSDATAPATAMTAPAEGSTTDRNPTLEWTWSDGATPAAGGGAYSAADFDATDYEV